MGNKQAGKLDQKTLNEKIDRKIDTYSVSQAEIAVQCRILVPPTLQIAPQITGKTTMSKGSQVSILPLLKNKSTHTDATFQIIYRNESQNVLHTPVDARRVFYLLGETNVDDSQYADSVNHPFNAKHGYIHSHCTNEYLKPGNSCETCVFSTRAPLCQSRGRINLSPHFERESKDVLFHDTCSPTQHYHSVNASGDNLSSSSGPEHRRIIENDEMTCKHQFCQTIPLEFSSYPAKPEQHYFTDHPLINTTLSDRSTFQNQNYADISDQNKYSNQFSEINLQSNQNFREQQTNSKSLSGLTNNTARNTTYGRMQNERQFGYSCSLPTVPEVIPVGSVSYMPKCKSVYSKQNEITGRNFEAKLIKKSKSWHNLTSLVDDKHVCDINPHKSMEAVSEDVIILKPQCKKENLLDDSVDSCNQCRYVASNRQKNQAYQSTSSLYDKYFRPLSQFAVPIHNADFEISKTSSAITPHIAMRNNAMNFNSHQGASYLQNPSEFLYHNSKKNQQAWSINSLDNIPVAMNNHIDRSQSMNLHPSESEKLHERKRGFPLGKSQIAMNSNSNYSIAPRRDPNGRQHAWAEHLGNSIHSRNSAEMIQNNKHRFFLKDTEKMDKVIADPNDRRIRSICDRFQCDLEVYSKVPKSGFLQYAIDLTAPDSVSLQACVRSLESAMEWCLSPKYFLGKRFQL